MLRIKICHSIFPSLAPPTFVERKIVTPHEGIRLFWSLSLVETNRANCLASVASHQKEGRYNEESNEGRNGPLTLSLLSLLLVVPSVSRAQESASTLSLMAQLISFNQVPSVLAKSKGLFEAQVAEDGTISFSLS